MNIVVNSPASFIKLSIRSFLIRLSSSINSNQNKDSSDYSTPVFIEATELEALINCPSKCLPKIVFGRLKANFIYLCAKSFVLFLSSSLTIVIYC